MARAAVIGISAWGAVIGITVAADTNLYACVPAGAFLPDSKSRHYIAAFKGGTDLAISVLVVDDEPAVRSIASDILSDAGFDTVAAADADQALHILTHDARVDVLFTDIRIPGAMNGLELARVAKRKWPALHVIITSGYFGDDFPAPEFLPKPWSASELVSRVAQAAG